MYKFLKGIIFFFIITLVACSQPLSDSEYLARAQDLLAQGDLHAASIELKNALRINPKAPQARWLLGKLQLDIDNAAAAEKELSRAGKLGVVAESVTPLMARALLLQGKNDAVLSLSSVGLSPRAAASIMATQGLALMAEKEMDKAEAKIGNALSLDPQSNSARKAQARLYGVKRNYADARREIQQVLETSTDDGEAWSLLGDIEKGDGKLERAEQAFDKAITARPYYMPDYLRRALALIALRKYDLAQKDINFLRQKAPGLQGVDYAQAMVYLMRQQLPQAQTFFTNVLKRNEMHLPANYYMGVIEYQQGNLEQAEIYATRFLSAAPGSIPGRKLLAMISLMRSRYSVAENLIRPVVAVRKDDIVALNFLATALMKQGKVSEGVELLERVVALRPDSSLAKMQLGVGLLAEGEENQGLEQMKAALKLNPKLRQAEILIILGHLTSKAYAQAIEAAKAYAGRAPDSPVSYYLLGRSYLAAKQDEEARKAFMEALKIDPGNPSASHSLAEMAIKQGDLVEARKYYEGVLAVRDNDLMTLIKLAELDASEGEEYPMQEHLQQALKAHPDAVQPRLILGRYFLEHGKPNQALVQISDIDNDAEEDVDILRLRAEAELALGEFGLARDILVGLGKRDPASAEAHFLLAQAYNGLGQNERMAEEMVKAVELNPEYFKARLVLARMLFREGKYDESGRHLSILKQQGDNDPDVMELEAELLSVKGDQRAAELILTQAFTKKPTTRFMLDVARHKWNLGEHEESVKIQQKWVNGHPDDKIARLALARSLVNSGRIEAALEQYQRVLEQDDRNLIALNELAWYLGDSRPEQALEYARLANDIAPNRPEILDTLAVAQWKSGNLRQAQRTIARALGKSPEAPSLLYHRARIELAAGEKESARKTLKKLLDDGDVFPEREDAERFLKEIDLTQ